MYVYLFNWRVEKQSGLIHQQFLKGAYFLSWFWGTCIIPNLDHSATHPFNLALEFVLYITNSWYVLYRDIQSSTPYLQDLFEHVLAADDFLVFKSVMVRRNIELELRALERLKIEMGLQPVAYRSGEENGMGAHDKASSQPNPEDEKTLSDVLKKSEEEYKLKCSMDEEELQKLIELVKAESLQLYKQNLEKKGNEVATEVLERDKKSEQQEPPCEAGSEGKKEREEGGMLNTATKVNSELVKGEAKEIESLPQKIEKKSLEQPLPNPQIVQPGQRDSVHNAVPQSLSGAEAAEMWLEKAKSDLHLTDSNTSSAHSLRTSSVRLIIIHNHLSAIDGIVDCGYHYCANCVRYISSISHTMG